MNFLRTLIGACAGMRFYELALAWTLADALKYLAKLSALATVVLVAALVPRSLQWTEQTQRWINEDLKPPAFSIDKGKLRTEVTQPQVRRADDFLFILDPKGSVPLTATGAMHGAIITNQRLFFWTGPKVEMQPLEVLPDGRVDGAYFATLMRLVIGLMIVPALGILFGVFCVVGLVQTFTFSALASVVERSLPVHYDFWQLARFAVLALTPTWVIAIGLSSLGVTGGGWLPIVYLCIYGFYFAGAAAACRPLIGGEPRE